MSDFDWRDSVRFVCHCGEQFCERVWHCPICLHHWLPNTSHKCKNCHKQKELPVKGTDYKRGEYR